MGNGCLEPDEVDALLSGQLDVAAIERAHAHIDECSSCRVVVGRLAGDASDPGNPATSVETDPDERLGNTAETVREGATPRPSAGRIRPLHVQQIGRYQVERALASGGMGVVLLAADDELKRKVVIKLLRHDVAGRSQDRQRLLREAQAMAKVSHPNVVPVYDVGVHEDQVFLAMEFLDGGDLATWMKKQRTCRDVLDKFVAAGRGLAAAHRAGLVHRDFKPHNVMLGSSGEVKVTDFGLARAEVAPVEPPQQPGDRPRVLTSRDGGLLVTTLLESPITRSGIQVGTPAYMAPEQILAEAVDARSDQFSFCVALFEALYGTRPFTGKTTEELFESTLEGKLPEELLRGDRVPRRVRQAVRRGLSVEPAQRFASMDELLAELAPPARRRTLLVAALAAIAVTGAVSAVVATRGEGASSLCTGDAAEIAGVWSPQRRHAIERAFLGTNVPMARTAWQAVATELDHYVTSWRGGHRDACQATRVRGDQPEAVMSQRMQCLQRRRAELAALVDLLSRPDAALVENAGSIVSRLTSPLTCSNAEALGSATELPDPKVRAEVTTVEGELAKAHAQIAAHRNEEAGALMTAMLVRTQQLGHKPLLAELHYQLGVNAVQMSAWADGAAHMHHALRVAEEAGVDRVRALAFTQLVEVAVAAGKFDEAKRWVDFAAATITRLGNDRALLGELDVRIGEMHQARGDEAASEKAYKVAIERLGQVHGPRSPPVAGAVSKLGALYRDMREYDKSFAQWELARDMWRDGPDRVSFANALSMMAAVRQLQQRFAEAVALSNEELAILTAYFGADHPRLAWAYSNLALSLQGLGKLDEAIAMMTKATALDEKLHGSSHPTHGAQLSSLAVLYASAQRTDEAYDTFARALETFRAAYGGDDHKDVVAVIEAMSTMRRRQGKLDEAAALLVRSRAIVGRTQEPNSTMMADTLTRIGALEILRKKYGEAAHVLEEALAMRVAARAAPWSLAWTKLELAKALWESGDDRARAVKLARESVTDAEADDPQQADDGRVWLADHGHK